jgi:hypothetical protein
MNSSHSLSCSNKILNFPDSDRLFMNTVRSHFMRGMRYWSPRVIQDKFSHKNKCKVRWMRSRSGQICNHCSVTWHFIKINIVFIFIKLLRLFISHYFKLWAWSENIFIFFYITLFKIRTKWDCAVAFYYEEPLHEFIAVCLLPQRRPSQVYLPVGKYISSRIKTISRTLHTTCQAAW